jgi:hypothetical protein
MGAGSMTFSTIHSEHEHQSDTEQEAGKITSQGIRTSFRSNCAKSRLPCHLHVGARWNTEHHVGQKILDIDHNILNAQISSLHGSIGMTLIAGSPLMPWQYHSLAPHPGVKKYSRSWPSNSRTPLVVPGHQDRTNFHRGVFAGQVCGSISPHQIITGPKVKRCDKRILRLDIHHPHRPSARLRAVGFDPDPNSNNQRWGKTNHRALPLQQTNAANGPSTWRPQL